MLSPAPGNPVVDGASLLSVSGGRDVSWGEGAHALDPPQEAVRATNSQPDLANRNLKSGAQESVL